MSVTVRVLGQEAPTPVEYSATDKALLILVDRSDPRSMPHIRIMQNGTLGCENLDPGLMTLMVIAMLRHIYQSSIHPWSKAAQRAIHVLDEAFTS